MKEFIKQFWQSPVKWKWITFVITSLITVLLCILWIFSGHLNKFQSVILTLSLFICEILWLFIVLLSGFSTAKRAIISLIKKIDRGMRYEEYQNRNTEKEYKGPYWNDKEFKKFELLEDQAKAFVTASIEFQQADFENWKKRNIGINLDHHSQTAKRNITILIAAFLSLLFFGVLVYWLGTNPNPQHIKEFDFNNLKKLIENSRGTVLIGITTTFIISPVIYVVWIFRDANNRVQIENSRKDTNLKDFQKLSEWASGFHLPESKETNIEKDILKPIKSNQALFDIDTKEKTKTIESNLPPDGSIIISRRQGAEALQASAISQLEAFMFGKYGDQFMQPAFLLIHSIWESIINQYLSRQESPQEFLRTLENLRRIPIISSINKALVNNHGFHLKLFENNLPSINLIGLNSDIYNNNFLCFSSSNISRANLSYCILTDASFAGANLALCNLSYSELKGANFCQSNLKFANLIGTDLSSALFINANLSAAKLQSCVLNNETRLTGANLSNATLMGTNVFEADFKNTIINSFTMFGRYENNIYEQNEIREDVLSRGAIWDDDPEWLVGKIQDAALLEKIRLGCAARAKQKGA